MLEYIIIIMLVAVIILLLILLFKSGNDGQDLDDTADNIERNLNLINENLGRSIVQVREDVQSSVRGIGDLLSQNQRIHNDALSDKINLIDRNITDKIGLLDKNISEKQQLSRTSMEQGTSRQEERFKTFADENRQQLEAIRLSVERRLNNIQSDNNQQLDNIRKIVDEKLQDTIEKKMTRSFEAVSQRLEEVHKGLGEMQNLAVSVGDLRNTLSNVKSRGVLGEIQLGSILEDILAPEQYERNVKVRKDSDFIVEFAIRMPAEENGFVYLPIDSKFPMDAYNALLKAYETGAKPELEAAQKALVQRIKQEANDISTKYISPPETTDFGIMFLPTEGLYAEAVKMGLIEELQRKYRVNIAGPGTMAALLNSLQMGFRTLAIQKRSSEVWEVLGAVRTEFDKFAKVLEKTQKSLTMANDDLDKLVGTRTRAIQRKLKSVDRLEESQSEQLITDEHE